MSWMILNGCQLCWRRSFLRSRSIASKSQLSTSTNLDVKGKGKAKETSSHTYADTLMLPKTPFGLRAEATKREKLFRPRFTKELYDWQANQKDRPLFILHDGPPYANGNLHIGHALNKILKDIINRSKLIQGHRIHYLPGWDTHGLPLELKALAVLKKPARDLPARVIRSAARTEASKGIKLQRDEFKDFGLLGEWDEGAGYWTMAWEYEKRQLGVVRDMVGKGLITSHHRPTLYSPSSRTALAEAELEYKEDHRSRSVYVAFPVTQLGSLRHILDTHNIDNTRAIELAVWTTTAWTLPSNVAIAVSTTMQYSLVECNQSKRLLIIASERVSALEQILSTTLSSLASFPGSDLLSTTYTSVLPSSSPSPNRPIIPASYVTSTTGTGLVHTAPAHGVEDWLAWTAHSATSNDIPCAVDSDGKFSTVLEGMVDSVTVTRLLGKEVLGNGTGEVIDILNEGGTMLKEVEIFHKFPYDWRTKKPVIFRATSQWFANLDKIKDAAIESLDRVKFYPSSGGKRLETYVRGRSEWCISRQRVWGVPIPVVYSFPTSSTDPIRDSIPHMTPSSIDHIISVLDRHGTGTDYWWEGKVEEFVEPSAMKRSIEVGGISWRKGEDTMDVWFDSGVSWRTIKDLKLRSERDGPIADVYIEGSDQHRGWFQSSLLTAISSSEEERPRAPYGCVITHGMVLDENGRKMSKSLGNVISPAIVIHGGKNLQKEPAYGTDVLRLWVASVESSRDVPIGPGILSQISDSLRKIRNTARFMLGNLNGREREEMVVKEMGLIERYVLNELWLLDQSARESYNSFAFNKIYQNVVTFSNTTLSSFYFDIIKDSLYADSVSNYHRRSIIYVLQQVLDTYTMIFAPIVPHLAEEIHHFASGARTDPKLNSDITTTSVFEKIWVPNQQWCDPEAKVEMEMLIGVRNEVMNLMEKARVAKLIGGSVEVELVLSNLKEGVDPITAHLSILKDLFIVSKVTIEKEAVPTHDLPWSFDTLFQLGEGHVRIQVIPASASKCPRCWTFAKVASESVEVCDRCEQVLAETANY